MRILIAYVPILHKGYLELFRAESKNVDALYLIGEGIIAGIPEMDYIKRKDALRALESEQIAKSIEAIGLFVNRVHVLNLESITILQSEDIILVMPDEDISREITKKYFGNRHIDFKSVFLRWHRDNVLEKKKVEAHRSILLSDFEKKMMHEAIEEGQKSFDWWRQVGGIIVRNGRPILVAHNAHIPDEQNPYSSGDPRSIFKKGIHIEISTAEHTEAILIAKAARYGISLWGTYLFVADFPCPPCAKLIANSGISKLYFNRGYSVLDGESVLKSNGVELVFIDM